MESPSSNKLSFNSIKKHLLFILFLISAVPAFTTPPSQPGPDNSIYYSDNKQFCLHLYFTHHMPKSSFPLATLGSKRWWGYKEIERFSLEYYSFPHPQIVLKNDGRYFALLSEGYERDFKSIRLAIYRSNGSRICQYETKDLFPKNVGLFPKWKSQPFFNLTFDESKNVLVLKAHPMNGDPTPAPAPALCAEILIDLESGKCLSSKSSLAPWFGSRFGFVAGPNENPQTSDGISEYLCSQDPPIGDYSKAPILPSEYFLSLAKDHPIPDYPPLAEIAKISGVVVLEFLVSTDGKVQCVRIVSGPPQLGYALRSSALKWSFNPPDSHGKQPGPFRGFIAFTGRVFLGEALD
jgi:TonB family protein